MYCEKCGAELPDNSKFCNVCGASITMQNTINADDRQNPQAPAAVVKKKKLSGKIIIGAVILAVIAVGVIFGAKFIFSKQAAKPFVGTCNIYDPVSGDHIIKIVNDGQTIAVTFMDFGEFEGGILSETKSSDGNGNIYKLNNITANKEANITVKEAIVRIPQNVGKNGIVGTWGASLLYISGSSSRGYSVQDMYLIWNITDDGTVITIGGQSDRSKNPIYDADKDIAEDFKTGQYETLLEGKWTEVASGVYRLRYKADGKEQDLLMEVMLDE